MYWFQRQGLKSRSTCHRGQDFCSNSIENSVTSILFKILVVKDTCLRVNILGFETLLLCLLGVWPREIFLNWILISFVISKVGIIIPIGVGVLSIAAVDNSYIIGQWFNVMVWKEELIITVLSLKGALNDGYYYFDKKRLLLMHLLSDILKSMVT